MGPRIVWQRSTMAFRILGLPNDLLRHGIQREAFLFPLISNLKEYMHGEVKEPIFYDRPFDSIIINDVPFIESITYSKDPPSASAPVPEPSTILLLGSGLRGRPTQMVKRGSTSTRTTRYTAN